MLAAEAAAVAMPVTELAPPDERATSKVLLLASSRANTRELNVRPEDLPHHWLPARLAVHPNPMQHHDTGYDDTGNVIRQRHPTGDIMVSAMATSSNRQQQHS